MEKDDKTQLDNQMSILVHYKSVFRTPEGESVLNDLMQKNHVLNGIFDKDPMVMAFREGQRSVIFEILNVLETDINKFKEMYSKNYLEN